MQIYSETSFDKQRVAACYTGVKQKFDKLMKANRAKLSLFTPTQMGEISSSVPIDTMMGIEIELEGVSFRNGTELLYYEATPDAPYPSSVIFFAKEDTSLREGGVEFISRAGLTGQEVMWGVRRLLFEDKSIHSNVSTSKRTSIHVHVNALDLTYGQLKKLVLYYTILEPLLFSISGDRQDNIFCVPLLNTPLPVEALFYADNSSGFDAAIGSWHKYCAFNMRPLREIGSIEFRHHAGSCDAFEIEQWMLMLHQLIVAAKDDLSFIELVTLMYQHINAGTFDAFMSKSFGVDFFGYEENTKHALARLVDPDTINYQDLNDTVSAAAKKAASKSKGKKVIINSPHPADFAIHDEWVHNTMNPNAPQFIYSPAPISFTIDSQGDMAWPDSTTSTQTENS